MWYVYVLRSLKDGRFYVGQTRSLEKRIARHNSGGNLYTKSHRPFELVYQECHNTSVEAMRRERQIKKYKSGRAFKKLLEKSDLHG